MYRRFDEDGTANMDFWTGVEIFIIFAAQGGKNNIKCPCRRCDNKRYQCPCTVKQHLGVFGFVPDYYTWRFHGERCRTDEDGPGDDQEVEEEDYAVCTSEITISVCINVIDVCINREFFVREHRMETRSSCFLRSMQSSTSSGHILRPCASKMMRSGVAMRLIACV